MNSKGERKFLYLQEEVNRLGSGWDVEYAKGLGQYDVAVLGDLIINEKTRKLSQFKVTEENFQELRDTLELALSKNKESTADRRELLIF